MIEHTDFTDDDMHAHGPSKSQRKRDKHALHLLAERLAHLPRRELERLNLSEATWNALDETHRIKDIRALGRHWKRIANLLEREDMAAVHALMDENDARERAAAAHHHLIERWRERLISDDHTALSEFIDEHPRVERQPLRALIRAAQRDHACGRTEAPRKLYRFLREALEPAADQS
ncbi:MAG: DUF615 domain-containing protein [Sphingobacteriia bacterium]|nr:DUF615 domain-containing protein [Sphingobacteriia bacterium]NCC40208.1 DUF615 domain-containing protein [Gammaproteobacteria bacterium]